MGNSHKKTSHFKLYINDWDIPFPKFYEFTNELGKTFSIGENGISPEGIPPIPQNIWPKAPENIYF